MRADASIGSYNKTKIAAVLFPGSRDFLSLIQFFPLLVGGDFVLVGFKEAQWAEQLQAE